jgi:hypothetical protein
MRSMATRQLSREASLLALCEAKGEEKKPTASGVRWGPNHTTKGWSGSSSAFPQFTRPSPLNLGQPAFRETHDSGQPHAQEKER